MTLHAVVVNGSKVLTFQMEGGEVSLPNGPVLESDFGHDEEQRKNAALTRIVHEKSGISVWGFKQIYSGADDNGLPVSGYLATGWMGGSKKDGKMVSKDDKCTIDWHLPTLDTSPIKEILRAAFARKM